MSEDTILTVSFNSNHIDSDETVKVVQKTFTTHYNLTTVYTQQGKESSWSFTGTIANLRKAGIIK